MTFRKEPTAYKLVFEKYEGFEVVVKSLSIDSLLKLMALASDFDESKGAEQTLELLSTFANCLIGWNLEDENGKPVPATLKGVRSQELTFIIEIITEWMNVLSKVSPNLEQNLNITQNLASLPMEGI